METIHLDEDNLKMDVIHLGCG